MKTRSLIFFFALQAFFATLSLAQETKVETSLEKSSLLFQTKRPLSIKLRFSIRDIKKFTTDSTYIGSTLYYKYKSLLYDSIAVKLRARGNFRRQYCYFVPLKLKVKKSLARGTLFEGNKKLKVVLPCSEHMNKNDYIVKEYMAYKLYELVSPVHYKTRLVNIEFIEEKKRRTKEQALKGILIEDLDNVAERFDGRELTRRIHPLQQDAHTSVKNAFFQYLIGNTDFSIRSQHNDKLLFIDKKVIIIPYDFDMSGLVDAHYATVSGIQNMPNKITAVTERLYKGYKRDESIFQEVRQEYLHHKIEMLNTVDGLQEFFQNQKQFIKAKQFIANFFEILENDKSFNKNILNKARPN